MSVSRARTDSTDPVPGREGTRVSAQPMEGPPPRASSRGNWGVRACRGGNARVGGERCGRGSRDRMLASARSPTSSQTGAQGRRARGPCSPIWGSQPQEAADPGNAASTSVSDGSPHPATALHTPNLTQDTVGHQGLGLPDPALTARVPQAEGAVVECRGPGRGRGPGGGAMRSLGRGGGGEQSHAVRLGGGASAEGAGPERPEARPDPVPRSAGTE